MNKRAIITAFHKYQPYGHEFYEPILSHYMRMLTRYKDEFDHVYLVDSTWDIENDLSQLVPWVTVIKVNSSLRYYDAYKEVLPQIKEDKVLFMDNDMIVYKKSVIEETFNKLEDYDVVSIYDSCGTYTTDKLNGGNKFCPYWFAARKDVLVTYRDVEWGPNMPKYETLGKLTEKMLDSGVHSYEQEEDKSNILFNETQDGDCSKDLGYYHVRAGSTPAILLAYKRNDIDQYWDYLYKQPKSEYLRQCCWYQYMGGDPTDIVNDSGIDPNAWVGYYKKFLVYHGL